MSVKTTSGSRRACGILSPFLRNRHRKVSVRQLHRSSLIRAIMTPMWRRIVIWAVLYAAPLAMLTAQDPTGEFTALYKKALSSMHDARTRDELLKVIDEFDAPDWQSVVPSGEKLTRTQALQQ